MAYPNPNIQEIGIIRPDSPYGAISVTTSSRIACANGTAKIAGVTSLIITPTDGTVYWGTSSSVTTSTGTPITQNNTAALRLYADTNIYLISAGTVNVRVIEA